MLMESKKRRIMVVALLGFAIGVAGVISAQLRLLNVEPRFAVLPGGAVFTLALVYANLFAFRCPRCRGHWQDLAMGRRSFFSLDRSLRYCPFCGADVDAEL
jgi:hypothetical protein